MSHWTNSIKTLYVSQISEDSISVGFYLMIFVSCSVCLLTNILIYVIFQNVWHERVVEYWKQMKSVVLKNSVRNVMDMNSNLGGFAAALKDKDIWVMNVAPVNMSSRLKIIYDRGLIGTVHDWCVTFHSFRYCSLCILVPPSHG